MAIYILLRRSAAIQYLILFLMGGFIYGALENISRGYSHISMFIAGGICFIGVGLINEVFSDRIALISQMFFSAIWITLIEFIFGAIVNLWLKLDVWDYSAEPYNVAGQICLGYGLIWFFLSLPGILLDDYMRYHLFGQVKHKYKIF